VHAGEEAELRGDDLLHFDVRSDNLCFVNGRTVFVDGNLACKGNGRFDVAFWLPSLRLEGGPDPWEVLPNTGALAAVVAGFFAARAGPAGPAGRANGTRLPARAGRSRAPLGCTGARSRAAMLDTEPSR
jgi:hypothetical protein